MSIFSEYKCGAVSYEELVSYCRQEEEKDRAYEDAKHERLSQEDEEEGDESDDEE